MSSILWKIISYFPVRYYVAATLLGGIFLLGHDYIRIAEVLSIASALNLFDILTLIENGDLYIVGPSHYTKIALPTFMQILFLTFFATVAITVRTDLMRRLKILLFGMLCFLAFIALEFLLIIIFYQIKITDFSLSFSQISAALTLVTGAVAIHFALFTNITLPARTRIKAVRKRRRGEEYFYLATVISITVFIFYCISYYLYAGLSAYRNWPSLDFVHIYLWLSLPPIINTSYWIANLIHETLPPRWIRRAKSGSESNLIQGENASLSISFLIPAYNEEKLAGRCIESIDKSAARYVGQVEIILVNDGSIDDTEKVVTVVIANLKHARGKIYTIPNSGKGYALEYGLGKTTGDIIFRTDADSMIDENALVPIVNRFKDPDVGCVTGWVLPLQRGKSIWLNAQYVQYAKAFYIRRAQETYDALLIPPGCSTAFRRSTLNITGGWVDNIFGEDSEIGNRVARYGYKVAFEPKSIVYSEVPVTLRGVMQQRGRWGTAFYQSRGRNWRLARELWTPRSLLFQWELISHASRLGKNIAYPVFTALIIAGCMGTLGVLPAGIGNFPGMSEAVWILLLKIGSVHLLLTTMQVVSIAYALRKARKISAIIYYPFIRVIDLMVSLVVRMVVIDALLHWSVKWRTYNTESFKALRKVVKRIDPLYPDGE